MLGVCTLDMHFVYVLLDWEGSVADGQVLRDATSRRHGLKVPFDSYVRFFTIKCFFPKFSTKRKWVLEEDAALVASMVNLLNVGTFNADTGFKAGYLNEMEKMLEKFLPHAMLKAKPNLESRIRTLKRDWEIIYDMRSGKKIAALVGTSISSLLLLKMLCGTNRPNEKDAQTVADIIEEIDVQDVATTNTHEERNNFHGCEADVSLDDIDLSVTQPQPPKNQGDSTFSKKKKKFDASDHISSTSFTDAATLLAENIRVVGL
ncbi:hypothetical protein PVK06_012280 [Gossypium arboreum]|uniref:Myb/SANT-like domain-containing protein n=1 Tax=Gossypium arboreum TaxID=29729 RepID=A0ABR0QB54_GOSAR|nr:hypothetical protein PVK06_012280 [Gossypium arboreum]